MANCTQCGAELKEGMRFCTSCGASVPEPVPAGPARPTAGETPAEPAPEPRPPIQEPTTPPAQDAAVPPPPYQPPPSYQPPPPPYQPPPGQGYYPPPGSGPAADGKPPAGSKYELISTGGFIGILLLMCIPIVGQILMIVWACGGCRKLQKKYMARASLILLVIGLVLSLILGFAFRGVVEGVMKDAGLSTPGQTSQSGSKSGGGGGLGGLLAGLAGGNSDESGGADGNLAALGGLLDALEGLQGEEPDAGDGSLDDLLDNVDRVNQDAAAKADGWPAPLPDYPGGSMNAVETYRTEFTGTTREEMLSYIDALKKAGFAYQDFYEFGMSEEDMLDMDGWWGTDGALYLSISYADGTVTIDHVTELPNLEDYFG